MDSPVFRQNPVHPDTGHSRASVQQLCQVWITQSLLLRWRICRHWRQKIAKTGESMQNHLLQDGTCLAPRGGCKLKRVHLQFKFSAVLLCLTWRDHTSNNTQLLRSVVLSSVFNIVYNFLYFHCLLPWVLLKVPKIKMYYYTPYY